MKKRNLLWGLLGLSMVLASCQKQEGPTLAPNASLTVTIPQDAIQTRAAGDGAQVNRCILQVYRNGAKYGERQVVGIDRSTGTAKAVFKDLQLVASQTYQFVFWADCGTGTNNLEDKRYNTDELTNITVNGDYIGNNEEFDAFFKCEELEVTDAFSANVTLTRPFGQLNVKTNDLDASNGIEALEPTNVTVTFASVPTSFNALEGTAGGNGEVTYNASILDQSQVESGHLTIDYLWASEDQNDLIDFEMQFLNASSEEITTNDNFRSIPIRRNYQTTVSGNLLTKKGTINVDIEADFADDEIKADVYEVSAGNLQTTLNGLSTKEVKAHKIVVTDNLAATTYILPALPEGASLSIAMVGADGAVTFSGEEFKGNFEISNTGSAVDLKINVPNGDATLGAGNWTNVSAVTKKNTFTIASGANVTTVTIEGGNVNVNKGAEVSTIVKGENNTDEETVVTLFDGATQPTVGEGITIQNGVTGQIVNKSTGKSYATIRDAVTYASAGDVIEIAAGSYDLDEPGQPDTQGPQGYYLKIDKGITLKGVGDVQIYTSHDANTGMWSLQNLVTVRAENVRIENITFIANYNGYYDGPNKTIEVYSNEGNNFTLVNCKLIDGGDKKDAGCLYIGTDSGSGQKATIEGCEFINSAVSVRVNTEATFTNCTFDGVRERSGWNCSVASRGVAYISSSSFKNCTTEAGMQPVVANGDGVVYLQSNVTFPTDGVYYRLADNGVVVNGSVLAAGSPTSFLKAQELAEDGGTILLQAGDYDFTTNGDQNQVGSSLEINKKGLTVKALDPNNKPVIYASSTSGNWYYGNVYGQNTLTVTADNVTLEDLIIMPLTNTGSYTNDYNKAVEVTNTATYFTMKNCEVTPNTKIDGNNTSGYGGQVSINTSKESSKNTIKILNNTFNGVILDPRTAVTATGNTFNGVSPIHKVLCRFRLQYDGSVDDNVQVYSDIEMSGNTYENITGADSRGVLYIEGGLIGIEAGLAAEFDVQNKTSVSEGAYYYNLK